MSYFLKQTCIAIILFFFGVTVIPNVHAESAAGSTLPVPESAEVYFVEPADGAKVSSPVTVKMGVKGMEVKKAGELIEGTGHHHLIIGGSGVKTGSVVPADEKHIHFGGGQTETQIELDKGTHQLTLQFADGGHRSYGPDLSATITVVVE